jgi:hypothetical protein
VVGHRRPTAGSRPQGWSPDRRPVRAQPPSAPPSQHRPAHPRRPAAGPAHLLSPLAGPVAPRQPACPSRARPARRGRTPRGRSGWRSPPSADRLARTAPHLLPPSCWPAIRGPRRRVRAVAAARVRDGHPVPAAPSPSWTAAHHSLPAPVPVRHRRARSGRRGLASRCPRPQRRGPVPTCARKRDRGMLTVMSCRQPSPRRGGLAPMRKRAEGRLSCRTIRTRGYANSPAPSGACSTSAAAQPLRKQVPPCVARAGGSSRRASP